MTKITSLVEVPEPIHSVVLSFLEAHPDWDWDRFVTEGLLLLLAKLEPYRLDQIRLKYQMVVSPDDYHDPGGNS